MELLELLSDPCPPPEGPSPMGGTCCTVCTVYCLYCVYCFPLWTPKISPIGLELIQFWLDLNFCGLDFFGPGFDLSAKLPTSKMTEFGHFSPFSYLENDPNVPFWLIFRPFLQKSFHFSPPSRPFLIDGVLGSRNLFSKS